MAVTLSFVLVGATLTVMGQSAHAADPGLAVDSCLDIQKDRVFDALAPVGVVDCADSHTAQVFAGTNYPDGLGAPSTINDRVYELFGQSCNYDNYRAWLGAGKVGLPIKGITVPRLPSDDEWEAGARGSRARSSLQMARAGR